MELVMAKSLRMRNIWVPLDSMAIIGMLQGGEPGIMKISPLIDSARR